MENLKKVEPEGWSVQGIWNTQLTLQRKDKKLEPREHIWASEIGKNHYERYLKMTGVKMDFDYDERTLRVFAAGDFFERIIGYVLIVSGLLKYDNKWYEIPADTEHLRISVKPDFIAGGKPDWAKVKKELDSNPLFVLMPTIERIARALVDELSAKYPDGLKDLVYEIKSVNSMVFWAKKDYLSDAYPHHKMQLFTGMKATKLPEGRILYISKDDLTTAEFPLRLDDPKLNKLWEDDVMLMTKYIREKKEPPKPQEIIFDESKSVKFQMDKKSYKTKGMYVPNWEIGWSMYLPTITGCKSKEEWEEKMDKMIKPMNDELKEKEKEKIIKSQK